MGPMRWGANGITDRDRPVLLPLWPLSEAVYAYIYTRSDLLMFTICRCFCLILLSQFNYLNLVILNLAQLAWHL